MPHLKRIWSAAMAVRNANIIDRNNESNWNRTILNAMGVGLHQTMEFLHMSAPSFSEFEAWITNIAGQPNELYIERLQAIVNNNPNSANVIEWFDSIEDMPAVFSDEDLEYWDTNGFVVLKNAVWVNERNDAEAAIWEYINATPTTPNSWYQSRVDHGIMLKLIQHPALEKNRQSKRIHKAFSQLWGTTDLWVTADRCSFHPPQQDNCPFPGPDLHWDIDFSKPIEFGTQGILYLTDTPPEQGALTLVPRFHKKISDWLSDLPTDSDPQQEDLHALGAKPIGGKAGDMIIWNHLLPHGSHSNLGKLPRIVQYINLHPSGFNEIT